MGKYVTDRKISDEVYSQCPLSIGHYIHSQCEQKKYDFLFHCKYYLMIIFCV